MDEKEEKVDANEAKAEIEETQKKEPKKVNEEKKAAKELKEKKTSENKAKKEVENENKSVGASNVNTEEVKKVVELSTANSEETKNDKKDTNQKSSTNENKDSKPKKKHTKLIVSAIIALLAMVVALVLWLVLKTKTIDLSECLNIKYNGYSGHATATIEIDEKKLKNKLDGKVSAKKFIEKADLEIENNKDLSNGNELTIKVKVSSSFLKDNKLKLKDTTIKIKVEGIQEPVEIDMSKYIKLEYKGFNKHAIAKIVLDEDKMKEDLGEDIATKLKDRLILNIDDNEDLENDDEVEVKISKRVVDSIGYYLGDMGVNLVSDVVKIRVEGLKEGTEVDAFKDIKVDFSGMSPNINVSISNNSDDEFLKTVEYKASKTSGIANGETITITAIKWDEEMAQEKEITLKETKKEYKVEGQSAYIFNKSEITDAVKTELKSIFVSKTTSKANEEYQGYDSDNFRRQLYDNTDYKYSGVNTYKEIDRDLSIGTPEVVSMYLLTKKPEMSFNTINKIVGIVKVPCKSAKTGATYNWYVTIEAENASLKEDRTISDNTNYIINVRDGKDEEKAYQTYVNDKKNGFNVDKISL